MDKYFKIDVLDDWNDWKYGLKLISNGYSLDDPNAFLTIVISRYETKFYKYVASMMNITSTNIRIDQTGESFYNLQNVNESAVSDLSKSKDVKSSENYNKIINENKNHEYDYYGQEISNLDKEIKEVESKINEITKQYKATSSITSSYDKAEAKAVNNSSKIEKLEKNIKSNNDEIQKLESMPDRKSEDNLKLSKLKQVNSNLTKMVENYKKDTVGNKPLNSSDDDKSSEIKNTLNSLELKLKELKSRKSNEIRRSKVNSSSKYEFRRLPIDYTKSIFNIYHSLKKINKNSYSIENLDALYKAILNTPIKELQDENLRRILDYIIKHKFVKKNSHYDYGGI